MVVSQAAATTAPTDAAAAAPASSTALATAAAAVSPRQQRQQHGLRHAASMRRPLRLLMLALLLATTLLALTPTATTAFVVPSRSTGRPSTQRSQQQSHPSPSSSSSSRSRRRPSSSSMAPRFVFNNFFGGGGDKGKQGKQKQAAAESPFRPELQGTYEDGLGAKIWIYLFSGKIAKVTGSKLPAFPISYDEYVRLSVVLQKGGPQVAKDAVLSVLRSIAFPGFSQIFRTLFPGSSRLACEFNARITPVFFEWLVGPATVEAAEVVNPKTGETEVWQSAVRIQRCRYLEAVQCKGACASICKVPTQSFFTDDLGMPVTMTPDFATLSCTMTFGQRPPTLGEDPVGSEPCYKECPSARTAAKACPKLTALAQAEDGAAA